MKNINKAILLLMCLTMMGTSTFAGGTDTWQGKGRIALSSDGNEHDHDDINATKMSLMILAKEGLQNNVVLYTYADHIWGSNQTTSDQLERMHTVALGGQERFGFQGANFMAAVEDPDKAYNAMAAVIAKSTADDPLFIIGAGPMHVIGEGLRIANSSTPASLNYVTVISHSTWNNNHGQSHKSPETTDHDGWTWDMMKNTFGSKVNFKKISDQNATPDANGNTYTNNDKFKASTMADWAWMNTHQDPNINWVYQNHTGKGSNSGADYSDAGMAFYLVTGDEMGNPVKLQNYIGADVIDVVVDTTRVSKVTLDESSILLEEVSDTKKLTPTILPETAENKEVTWSSSDNTVAVVSADGTITGLSKGNCKITVTTVDRSKTASCLVQVGVIEAGETTVGENFIAIEAESTKSTLGQWVVRTGKTGLDNATLDASNNTFLEYTGGTEDGNTSGQDILVYKFTPASTGNYRLTGRMAQNQNGAAWDKCNDIYVKMAGDFTSANGTAMSILTSWTKLYGRGIEDWGAFVQMDVNHAKYVPIYKLTAGVEYTLSVSGRATRTCVDYYLLYKSETAGVTVAEKKDLFTNTPDYMRPTGSTYIPSVIIKAHDFTNTEVEGYDPATKGTIPNSPADGINKGEQVIGCGGTNGITKDIAAEIVYGGADANVTFTVKTVGEPDGECTFAVFINGVKVGEKQASRIHGTDIAPYTYEELVIDTNKIALKQGDTIRVTSNQVSNNLVAEGNGFATARGRWVSLEVVGGYDWTDGGSGEPVENPEITSNNAPTQVLVGTESINVKVSYTSYETLDFSGDIHHLLEGGGNEGCAFKRINGVPAAENGTLDVTFELTRDLVVGDDYRFVMYFMPTGMTWKEQFKPVTNVYFDVVTELAIGDVKNNLKVYPSFFTNQVTIESAEVVENAKMHNLSGQTVLNQEINNKHYILNTQQLPNGMYILKLSLTNGTQSTQKLMKK